MTHSPSEFAVYSEGLCYASVCTSLSNEAAEGRMFPSGTRHGWQVATDRTFATGEPNGSPCPDHPDTHRHLLMEC